MNNPFFVRRLQRFRHLGADAQCLVKRNRAGSQNPVQGHPRYQFQHQEADSARFFQPVEGGNIGMVQ